MSESTVNMITKHSGTIKWQLPVNEHGNRWRWREVADLAVRNQEDEKGTSNS